jgi:hypothetical protein
MVGGTIPNNLQVPGFWTTGEFPALGPGEILGP